jgi:hypothetical protein
MEKAAVGIAFALDEREDWKRSWTKKPAKSAKDG